MLPKSYHNVDVIYGIENRRREKWEKADYGHARISGRFSTHRHLFRHYQQHLTLTPNNPIQSIQYSKTFSVLPSPSCFTIKFSQLFNVLRNFHSGRLELKDPSYQYQKLEPELQTSIEQPTTAFLSSPASLSSFLNPLRQSNPRVYPPGNL
ncbi:hypothetical protein EYC80_000685 [Monilinia laxa]|uniref:Uncharacterized protein n=1 Tax=Monilinia laxa TaxID=61186 RepID=A0A5N6KBG7_MONLA|nr:hypothetical protein EYC80_000685 [Monilinia laxa]